MSFDGQIRLGADDAPLPRSIHGFECSHSENIVEPSPTQLYRSGQQPPGGSVALFGLTPGNSANRPTAFRLDMGCAPPLLTPDFGSGDDRSPNIKHEILARMGLYWSAYMHSSTFETEHFVASVDV